MSEETRETVEEQEKEGDWLFLRQVMREYDLSPTYIYRLADQGILETRIVQTKRVRHEQQYSRRSLDRWQENRPARFKRKVTENESPGRQVSVVA